MSAEMVPLNKFLSPIDIPLEQIFLDPNNPRFTVADWTYIPSEQWDKPDVQEVAQRRLLADFDVEKLRMSMEVNGFLPIDRVIVKRFSENKYIVLEGNRRICAAKLIGSLAIDGSNVSVAVKDSLSEIPCLQYTGTDEDAAWVFQGLRHISGVVEWSAFNKAKLLVEQMEKDDLTLTEVGKRFGLTSHGAGQWVRGYRAFHQARQSSDYINEVDENSYPYFQELFGRSSAPIREWLEWDESNYEFTNKLNLDEFISWLYPRPNNGQEDGLSKKGDFGSRRLARRDDIRQLSVVFVNEKELFEQFRSGIELEACYSQMLTRQYERENKKKLDPVSDLYLAIDVCIKCIGNIPYKAMMNQDTKGKIIQSLENLEAAISDVKE
ncbi:ParB N-terminal domain-containing protein [Aeromonas hydrophila]|uniref:ParB N-terminal domain-containing protein n=1 Tax=Aeromonas hydrophila TaxID=644 RepID=UPI00111BD952|nr:ParB N-terminal domain-containing protein [Aeromonas hydrophila]